jgi:hypothetical protein
MSPAAAGVAALVRAYGITATMPGEAGYQSVVSQVVSAVMGRGVFYYITVTAVLTVLALSANTSFGDFPRVCCVRATDRYLPPEFARRGSRLVFTNGILVLSALSALLLLILGGITDHPIPPFAVGELTAARPDRQVIVLIPELMQRRWYPDLSPSQAQMRCVSRVPCGI